MAQISLDLKAWTQAQLQNQRHAGVELSLVSGEREYRVVILKKEKGEIEIEEQTDSIKDLAALSELLAEEQIPVYLSISGRGILHKLVDQPTGMQQQLIQAVLPSAGPEQFYLQENPGAKGLFASIARKQLIDELLEEFRQAGIWVIGLSFGGFDMRYLLPFLNGQKELSSRTQQLQFNEEGATERITPANTDIESRIRLGDQEMETRWVLAYALAFKGLMQMESGVGTPVLEEQQEEFKHMRLFQLGGKLILGLLFTVLLINVFFYYQYKSNNEQLGAAMAQSRYQLIELDSLRKQVEQQEAMLKQTSVNQDTRLSFYADQLGQSLPAGIQLLELEVFPMLGRKRDYEKEDLIRYDKRRIQIKGICKSSLIYNSWIKELKELEWVEEARHLNYSDISKNLGEFELAILL
ncbi:MAG: hypothetical protein AAFP19_04210 [Bacteroidota bacterium]